MTARAHCPSCQAPMIPNYYLCKGCWRRLTPAARAALLTKDGIPAARRLGELLTQLKANVPLPEIEITP